MEIVANEIFWQVESAESGNCGKWRLWKLEIVENGDFGKYYLWKIEIG